jgi:hypothetical protein
MHMKKFGLALMTAAALLLAPAILVPSAATAKPAVAIEDTSTDLSSHRRHRYRSWHRGHRHGWRGQRHWRHSGYRARHYGWRGHRYYRSHRPYYRHYGYRRPYAGVRIW